MSRVSKEKNREYQKTWYKKNRELHFARIKQRELFIKERFRNFKTGLSCSLCGESHPSCIDFHHIDRNKKEIGMSKAVRRGWGWNKIMEEVAKCKIVCSNCHKKIHWEEMNASSWGGGIQI